MENECPQTKAQVLDSLFDRYPDMILCESEARAAVDLLIDSFSSGGKLLVCGNGGSAADSEHIVGELMKSFRFKRPVSQDFLSSYRRANGVDAPDWLEGALPAISLVSQSALLTAFGNDQDSVGAFAQQVYAYGCDSDILLAISTSGNSSNVVEAVKVARAKGIRIISLTGSKESRLTSLSDVCVRVPRDEVFQVQELHLPFYHCLCACVEAEFFGGGRE